MMMLALRKAVSFLKKYFRPVRKGNEQTFKEIRRKVATQGSFQERDNSKSRSEMERMMQSIEDLQSRQAEFEKALEQKEAEKLLIYQVLYCFCVEYIILTYLLTHLPSCPLFTLMSHRFSVTFPPCYLFMVASTHAPYVKITYHSQSCFRVFQEMIQSKHRQDVLEARMSRMVGVLMQACHSIGLTQIEGDGGSNLLQILDCETSDSMRVSKRQRLLENAPVSPMIERAISPVIDGYKFQVCSVASPTAASPTALLIMSRVAEYIGCNEHHSLRLNGQRSARCVKCKTFIGVGT
jgi:hypothetical protein